jgi:hypothetical protein
LDAHGLHELPDRQTMLVLKQFTQATTSGSKTTVSEGWVFSSKSLLLNLANVLQATNGTNVYVSCDGTYKLLHNGWVLLNLISETIVNSDGGISSLGISFACWCAAIIRKLLYFILIPCML